MNIIKEITTHKAVKEDGVINIYEKGLDLPGLFYPDELINTIKVADEDSLLPMFEMFEENNRINLAEANNEFSRM